MFVRSFLLSRASYIVVVVSLRFRMVLSESRAIKTELEEDPRKRRQIKDVMTSSLRSGGQYNPDDDDDDDSD